MHVCVCVCMCSLVCTCLGGVEGAQAEDPEAVVVAICSLGGLWEPQFP